MEAFDLRNVDKKEDNIVEADLTVESLSLPEMNSRKVKGKVSFLFFFILIL